MPPLQEESKKLVMTKYGTLYCFVPKADYELMEIHKGVMQLESQQNRIDNYITVEVSRCIAGDDKSPYVGQAEIVMDYNNPQDLCEDSDIAI